MNNEELDSQLSAMFDDELPTSECELLARRLARDEAIKARWGRYAAIGAAIRQERGVRLDGNLARRVSAAVASEPSLLAAPSAGGRAARPVIRRWWQPVAGAAVAAGVATLSVLWLRAQSPMAGFAPVSAPLLSATVPEKIPLAAAPERDSYIVPREVEQNSFMPPSQLANYVIAHSEFSSPMLRSSVLSSLAAELGAVGGVPSRPKADRTPDAHEAP